MIDDALEFERADGFRWDELKQECIEIRQ